MSKGQGLTAGALLLGAALLRPGLSGLTSQVHDTAPAPAVAAATEKLAGADASDGPWIASCKHWRPSGWTDPVSANRRDTDPHVSQSRKAAPTCSAAQWGFAQLSDEGGHPAITAMIATLPDPVHSSLALDFDRLVDVITQAAADNNYLISHSWLPWSQPPAENAKSSRAVSPEEQKAIQEREKQPGLLILKPARAVAGSRLIYLFLVAQTPALGINGEQMRNALDYEEVLHRKYGATLSLRDPAAGVDVIGPNHSGSADSLRSALMQAPFADDHSITFHVFGTTSTEEATDALAAHNSSGSRRIDYISFGEDTLLEQRVIRSLFASPSYGSSRLALLSESGTAYGSAVRFYGGAPSRDEPIVINFPREISLLRNAQKDNSSASDAAGSVDPYLHLSLKNSGTEDTIEHFAPEMTPFSQEAQWMELIRDLKTRHVDVVCVTATNIVDELFLTKNLHRDLPDARIVVFEASDLLFARLGDSAPYVGTIAATGYPLVNLESSVSPRTLRNFASTWTEQYYNAVSFALWDGTSFRSLSLGGYGLPSGSSVRPPPLWMTVVGRDGYYPLSVVDRCSSNNAHILPVLIRDGAVGGRELPPNVTEEVCAPGQQDPDESLGRVFSSDRRYPGLSWYALCLVVTLSCLTHAIVLRTASFWSPTTRDLAIEWSDEPRRRAVYLHIATAMLFSMSVVTVIPIFCSLHLLHSSLFTLAVAVVTLLSGTVAAAATLHRTSSFLRRAWEGRRTRANCHTIGREDAGLEPATEEEKDLLSEESLFAVFNLIALLAALLIPSIWCALCLDRNSNAEQHLYLGQFFAYRCLYPASGVSPLVPVLLVLLSWYLWAVCQTKRLRFSANSRPKLPGRIPDSPAGLYVPEDALMACSSPVDSCLFENMTCLLITRQLVHRVLHRPGSSINAALATTYTLLFLLFVFAFPIQGLDHFLRHSFLHVTLYEFLVSALFYPLLVVALTGCLRMVLIWSSLRGGLLEPLERSPLRFAFSRLTNVAWVTMFKQNGVFEYWRDMTRSNQSLRQMQHCPDLEGAMTALDGTCWRQASNAHRKLEEHIKMLLLQIECAKGERREGATLAEAWDACGNFLSGDDLPHVDHRAFLNLMGAIECDYVLFAEALLAGALIPHWTRSCAGLVESEPDSTEARVTLPTSPLHIQLAEEFLALRYFSLIRSVLINLRQLMTFVSVSFVLALIAWNSYPFQPRQWIDWAFTTLLFGLGAAVMWMFAQMHRNSILSRITGTQPNELGTDFYLRLATFGAVPVLTWLASQFPSMGGGISRLLQSGLQLGK